MYTIRVGDVQTQVDLKPEQLAGVAHARLVVPVPLTITVGETTHDPYVIIYTSSNLLAMYDRIEYPLEMDKWDDYLVKLLADKPRLNKACVVSGPNKYIIVQMDNPEFLQGIEMMAELAGVEITVDKLTDL